LGSVLSDIMKLRPEVGSVPPELEGLICGVGYKEVEWPLEKQMHMYDVKWNSGNETYISKARSLQLQFLHRLSLPVLTGTKIRGEKSTSVGIALYDVLTGQRVDSGPEASAKVEIVVLEKDFTGYEGANSSPEEFNSKIVREREGGKTLLTGDVHVNLKEGIGFIGDVYFRHTKCWMKRTEFRLGARTVDGALGLRVREAKTEPFIVEDRRAKLYQKNYPPSLSDAVWRLEKIGKDGASHDRLSKENINTVKDFVTLLNINPQRLKQILGMPAKMWDITVDHAKTCVLDKRAFLYYSPTSQQKTAVVFNVVGQLMGLLMEHEFIPVEKLSETEKANINKLVVSAFQQWEQLVPVDDVSSLLVGSQQLTNAHHPSTLTTLESPNVCSFDTSDMFDNHSTDVSSPGGASTLDDFCSPGFENLDNSSGVDLEYVGQDITDEYLNLNNINDLPNGLYLSNPVIAKISDGNTILTSHNLPQSENPQLDACSHEIVSPFYCPWGVNFLGDYDWQSIDDISYRYEQTLTFASPVASSALCDTESLSQAFSMCNHQQISDSHCSLQSLDTNPGLTSGPHGAVTDLILAGSSDVAKYKAQRRNLSRQNAQRRWKMVFSVMRWFSVRRNVARETFLEELHNDPNASSRANVQSAVNDIFFSSNKAKRRYLSKKDKAKRRWRMLFSIARWFSVKRNVAIKTSTEETPFTMNGLDNVGSLQSTHSTNCSSEESMAGQITNSLIRDMKSTTQGFCDDGNVQIFGTNGSLQSQNSNPELQASLHDAINDMLLAHSSAVATNKAQRRYLSR